MEPLTPAQCEAFVAQLAEPTTRRGAKQLVAARAVATLLKSWTMKTSRSFGPPPSRWASARVEAIEPLCRLLDRNVLGAAVSEALRRITGKDFGRDTAKWRACLGGPSSAGRPRDQRHRRPHPPGGRRLGVRPTASGKSFWFRVRLSPERTQDVAVQVSRGETPGDELVLVYTECGPADARLYETLLRKNLTLPPGRLPFATSTATPISPWSIRWPPRRRPPTIWPGGSSGSPHRPKSSKASWRNRSRTIMAELGVNIDHVATVRQARRTYEPDPVWAAALAELGGADGITLHLREDRRHIQDRDLRILRQTVTVKLNLEMACDPEVLAIACEVKPDQVTLVPERREEVTTEGGLDVAAQRDRVGRGVGRLQEAGI